MRERKRFAALSVKTPDYRLDFGQCPGFESGWALSEEKSLSHRERFRYGDCPVRIWPEGVHIDEVKQTAGLFFFLNFVVIMFSYVLYNEGMPWGLATLAISGATSIMFALSVAFSTFGAVKRSTASLAAGFIGLAISLVSVVVIMMQYVTNHSN